MRRKKTMKKKRGGMPSNSSLEPEPEPEADPSSDSLETIRLKRDFLEGIEEEFPLGTRAEEWLPTDIEHRLYTEIVDEREDWYKHPYNKFYTKECSGLKEFCELFPKICYFNPDYLEKVRICQHIPYICIRDTIRSIRTVNRYLNNRKWNTFFERELDEYLRNGVSMKRIYSYLDDVFVTTCDKVFILHIPNYRLDMPLREFFTMLNQKSNAELSDIFLDILEISLEIFSPKYLRMPFQMNRSLNPEQMNIQRRMTLKSIVQSDFCKFIKLFAIGNKTTNDMRVNDDTYE